MPKIISKDLLILQKLNKETNTKVNKQHTLLSCAVRILVLVLLVMLFYGCMFLFALSRDGVW